METTRTNPPIPNGTAILTTVEEQSNDGSEVPVNGVLRLRGGRIKPRRVTWTEEVIDNEGLDKKKTKICCIYNKPREFGESSSDDSSSSSSSDEDSEDGKDEESQVKGQGNSHRKDSNPSHDTNLESHTCNQHPRKRQRRKNAYEKQPSQTRKLPQ
ncbi:Type 1 phosphatases regulator ypi1 [Orbilia ellipsospora]|uniref:Type 1 phosphatases regulator n=1 Tax=Orbilia ellipsospora TaxID=2528407 RepID=A0AAV9X2X2_9PEZI